MLKDLIDERLEFMYAKLSRGPVDILMPPTDLSFPSNFIEKRLGATKSFHIFSFEEVGMFDPFPKELMDVNFHIPTEAADLVYRG